MNLSTLIKINNNPASFRNSNLEGLVQFIIGSYMLFIFVNPLVSSTIVSKLVLTNKYILH